VLEMPVEWRQYGQTKHQCADCGRVIRWQLLLCSDCWDRNGTNSAIFPGNDNTNLVTVRSHGAPRQSSTRTRRP